MGKIEKTELSISMTDSAQKHFSGLITKEDVAGTNLRIFVDGPGSPNAQIGITFCPPKEHRAADTALDYAEFTLFVDGASIPFLQDANIDFHTDNVGGQLAITAPNLKGVQPDKDTPIAQQIEYILNSQINPNLASHGGMVSLVEVNSDNEVFLKFGGGCQGCGMADITLKQGIEKTLMEQIPQISAINDITSHESGTNPYYASDNTNENS